MAGLTRVETPGGSFVDGEPQADHKKTLPEDLLMMQLENKLSAEEDQFGPFYGQECDEPPAEECKETFLPVVIEEDSTDLLREAENSISEVQRQGSELPGNPARYETDEKVDEKHVSFSGRADDSVNSVCYQGDSENPFKPISAVKPKYEIPKQDQD